MPRHDELSACQGHRMRTVGMVGAHQIQSALQAGPAEVTQILRLPAQLLEAWVIGKTCGRHCDLLSPPAVRYIRLKGGPLAMPFMKSSPGGLSPVRGPEASRTPAVTIASRG